MKINKEMGCVFCEIARKERDAFIIYEDELFLSFLDINPRSLGHALLVPKRHVSRLEELNEEEASQIAKSLKNVMSILKEKLNAGGFTIAIDNGEFAGQEVKHLHVHIIPRYRRGPAIIAAFPVIGELKERLHEIHKVITGAS